MRSVQGINSRNKCASVWRGLDMGTDKNWSFKNRLGVTTGKDCSAVYYVEQQLELKVENES